MKLMRLDKYLSLAGIATRTETSKAVRGGEVLVDGIPAKKADMQVDPDTVAVIFKGQPVTYRRFTYILMHKPDGVVSATEDGRDRTVLDLLPPEVNKTGLFPCGRLDKNTLGLMLLTDNGELAHRLLAPKSHVAKTSTFTVKFPLSDADVEALESGVPIGTKDGGTYLTAPAKVCITGEDRTTGEITLVEGKYHQIKFMMIAVHNQITSLARKTFGPLTLDPT
ncbi:MAG: rRNA pseudouridine synthase, partial [Clostridia bacterium]|nr:rRNA pseudouridine synthase [Clostridia bacterium]